MRTRWAVAAGAILFFVTEAFAHHRVEVQYNPNMPIQLRGTLTRVAWDNPHVRFYLEANALVTGRVVFQDRMVA